MAIKHAEWKNFVDYDMLDNGGGIVNPEKYVDDTNPYYKSYTNSYLAKIPLWGSAQGDMRTHYTMTNSIPFKLDGDFTLIINPFKQVFTQTNGSAGHSLVIKMIMGTGAENQHGNKYLEGLSVLKAQDNSGSSNSLSGDISTIVFDYDDIDISNASSTFSSRAETPGYNSGDYRETTRGSRSEIMERDYSTGAFRGIDIRFVVGFYKSTTPAWTQNINQFIHLLLVPHKARGTYTS